MIEALVIAAFALIGVITQTVVGFGIAFFLPPVLLAYFSPPVTITIMLGVGTAASMLVLYRERRTNELVWPVILRLFAASVPGLLIGAYIITRIDKAWLQIIIGILIIIGVLIQEYAFPKPTKPLGVSRGMALSGFIGGVMNATAALAAPPLIVWMRTHVTTPNQIRHNLAALFILINGASIIAIHVIKPQSLDSKGLMIFALLLPVIVVGNQIGKVVASRVNLKYYHKIIFVAIVAAGIASIAFGISGLR
jgi:uncharacterized protein